MRQSSKAPIRDGSFEEQLRYIDEVIDDCKIRIKTGPSWKKEGSERLEHYESRVKQWTADIQVFIALCQIQRARILGSDQVVH